MIDAPKDYKRFLGREDNKTKITTNRGNENSLSLSLSSFSSPGISLVSVWPGREERRVTFIGEKSLVNLFSLSNTSINEKRNGRGKRREREGSDRKIAALENRKSKERRQQKHEKERRIQIKK